MRLQRNVIAFTLLSTALGCAIVAGKGDYRAYRQVEMADDDRARQRAMAEYIEEHPDGRWSADIRAEREEQEVGLFEANKSTGDGLQYYLDLYPQGQFSEQAQARLAALRSVSKNREGENEARRDVQRERREEGLAARRQWATKAVSYWSRILMSVENWGSPIAEVAGGNAEFNRAFGAQPRPRCSREECIKFYQLDFAIPVPGQTRIERSLRILLRLRLQEGKLVRAELLLPDRGFSRWYELQEQQFIADADPEARQHAIDWALEHIIPLIRELAPQAEGIDVVPEPIDPPTVRAPNQPDPGASAVPGEPVTEATGNGPQPTGEAAEAQPETPESTEPAELVLPLALQGLRAGELRVVVFAAADDDEGPAYDGVFIEHSSAAPPAE